jgi:hypothetical protein
VIGYGRDAPWSSGASPAEASAGKGEVVNRGYLAILVVSVTLLGTVAPALADEAGGGKKMPRWPLRWKATSPSTHEGDRYTLLVTNTDEEVQEAQVRTDLMDHPETNMIVVEERIVLEPGEEREFTAYNDYGTAEHFTTIIGSETQDLDLAVSIVDAAETETAQFNQAAFQVQEGKGKGGAKGNGTTANKHGHDEEFAIFVPMAFRDAARLSPLSLGVLAVAGTGLFAVRRRWAWAGPASGGLARSVVFPSFCRAASSRWPRPQCCPPRRPCSGTSRGGGYSGGFFLCCRSGRCDCRRRHFGVALAPGVPERSSAFAHTGGVLGGLPVRAPARLREGLHRRSGGVGHQGSGVGGGSSLHRLVASCSPCPPARQDRARRSIAPTRAR